MGKGGPWAQPRVGEAAVRAGGAGPPGYTGAGARALAGDDAGPLAAEPTPRDMAPGHQPQALARLRPASAHGPLDGPRLLSPYGHSLSALRSAPCLAGARPVPRVPQPLEAAPGPGHMRGRVQDGAGVAHAR